MTTRRSIRARYERVAYRREAVRVLDRIGLRRCDIVGTLMKHGDLDGYKNPFRIVDKDLAAVRAANRREIDAQTQEAAWYEYIGRLERMYLEPIAKHAFGPALEIAKCKARAKGLRVDEPIVLQSKIDIEIAVQHIVGLVREEVGSEEAVARILKRLRDGGLLSASGSEMSTVSGRTGAAGPPAAELDKKAG